MSCTNFSREFTNWSDLFKEAADSWTDPFKEDVGWTELFEKAMVQADAGMSNSRQPPLVHTTNEMFRQRQVVGFSGVRRTTPDGFLFSSASVYKMLGREYAV